MLLHREETPEIESVSEESGCRNSLPSSPLNARLNRPASRGNRRNIVSGPLQQRSEKFASPQVFVSAACPSRNHGRQCGRRLPRQLLTRVVPRLFRPFSGMEKPFCFCGEGNGCRCAVACRQRSERACPGGRARCGRRPLAQHAKTRSEGGRNHERTIAGVEGRSAGGALAR